MLAYRLKKNAVSASVFACAVGLFGCDDAAQDLKDMQASGKPFHYSLDGELRLSQVQVRGTHNSYHVDTNNGSFAPWAYTHAPIYDQLDRLAIRQLEFDVSLDDDEVKVYHVPGVDAGTRCALLSDCLAEVRRFSDAYPGHLPLYIQIEPKSDDIAPEDMEPFFAAVEGVIGKAFPKERVITPDEMQGNFPTLREAIATDGWPVLGKLRGRVMFTFDNSAKIRTAYTHNLSDLKGRVLFVDSAPADPFAAVAILNDPLSMSDADAIAVALKKNMLVRTRADTDGDEARANDPRRGNAALASGAHFISTDFPEPTPTITYHFEVPGGTPARCNPVTAPKSCTAQALEDPAFVGSKDPAGQ